MSKWSHLAPMKSFVANGTDLFENKQMPVCFKIGASSAVSPQKADLKDFCLRKKIMRIAADGALPKDLS